MKKKIRCYFGMSLLMAVMFLLAGCTETETGTDTSNQIQQNENVGYRNIGEIPEQNTTQDNSANTTKNTNSNTAKGNNNKKTKSYWVVCEITLTNTLTTIFQDIPQVEGVYLDGKQMDINYMTAEGEASDNEVSFCVKLPEGTTHTLTVDTDVADPISIDFEFDDRYIYPDGFYYKNGSKKITARAEYCFNYSFEKFGKKVVLTREVDDLQENGYMKGYFKALKDDSGDYGERYDGMYILPQSSSRKLKNKDIKGLSSRELRLARNEIYARHGRLFTDEELQNYFNSMSWYEGYISPEDFNDSAELNNIERYNVKFIQEHE